MGSPPLLVLLPLGVPAKALQVIQSIFLRIFMVIDLLGEIFQIVWVARWPPTGVVQLSPRRSCFSAMRLDCVLQSFFDFTTVRRETCVRVVFVVDFITLII